MKQEDILDLAKEIGFSRAGPVDMTGLRPMDKIREMCTADRCGHFGRSWSCPPAPSCASAESVHNRMMTYSEGILVQYTGSMSDPFDMEAIRSAEKRHKKMFDTLVRQVRLKGLECMPLGSGPCTVCFRCTYPSRPCRHPDRMYPSMEACGLWVSDVCVRSGLGYNYGENTITYTACLLYRLKDPGKL